MDDIDLGKILNYFYVFFVVILIVMIVFFSRLVSIMLTQKKNTPFDKVNAAQPAATQSYLEDAYTMTVRLTQLAQLQSTSAGVMTPSQKEVIVTLAEGRKQAMLAVMNENPQAVQSTIFSEDLIAFLPEEAKMFIEKKGTLEGVVESTGVDAGEPKEFGKNFTLTTQNGSLYILHFVSADIGLPQTGTQMIVQGTILDNHVLVSSLRKI